MRSTTGPLLALAVTVSLTGGCSSGSDGGPTTDAVATTSPATTARPSGAPSPTTTAAVYAPNMLPDDVVATIDVADAPMTPAVGFGSVWVSNHHADVVSRVDPETNEVVAEISTGVQPGQMLVTDDAVWVANYGEASLTRIDPNRNTSTIVHAGDTPACAAPAEAGGLVWIDNCDVGKLHGIDPESGDVVATLDATGFLYSMDGEMWIGTDDGLEQLDPASGETLQTIALGCAAAAGPNSFDGKRMFVAYRDGDVCQDGHVAVIDRSTGRVLQRVDVGRAPEAPIADGGTLYVNNSFDDTISIIDGRRGELLTEIDAPPVSEGLFAVGFDSIWVPDFDLSNLYRVDPET
jgi:YVTN family beta-propeller protein